MGWDSALLQAQPHTLSGYCIGLRGAWFKISYPVAHKDRLRSGSSVFILWFSDPQGLNIESEAGDPGRVCARTQVVGGRS